MNRLLTLYCLFVAASHGLKIDKSYAAVVDQTPAQSDESLNDLASLASNTELSISSPPSFRSAVIPYASTADYALPIRENLAWDLENLEELITNSAKQGAQLAVLSETATWGWAVSPGDQWGAWSRTTLLELAEEWPAKGWQATEEDCNAWQARSVIKASIAYSCVAQAGKINLVVNTARKINCSDSLECPADGFYIFNTNVAFAKDGSILAFYHKRHLYGEATVIDQPPVAFQNDGRFTINILDNNGLSHDIPIAMVICYDLYFSEPIMASVQEEGIRHIAFSAAWTPSPPMYNVPMLLQGLSRELEVAVIGANSFDNGSGIFVNGIAIDYGFEASNDRPLLADIPISLVDKEPIDTNAVPKLLTTATSTVDQKCTTWYEASGYTDTFSGLCAIKNIDDLGIGSVSLNLIIPDRCAVKVSLGLEAGENEELSLALIAFQNTWQPPFTTPSWSARGCGLIFCRKKTLADGSIDCLPDWSGISRNSTIHSLQMSFKGDPADVYPTIPMVSTSRGLLLKANEYEFFYRKETGHYEIYGGKENQFSQLHSLVIYQRF
ncbi:nitrilase-related carbon-nitrogen hydrolase [Pseudobacteriovorax antillogorgiicola]|uniref:nitrilase-related carbon-nitrogen hydrolase n=1 Tax=Pseudobacteriovorax antillogorgiicola TaxID=1513793 RepID=UPI0013564CC2|nr:nitrilase-related carbon-nitrogen hydrolase [Pseudobacteriovorax antillogorgiicola]